MIKNLLFLGIIYINVYKNPNFRVSSPFISKCNVAARECKDAGIYNSLSGCEWPTEVLDTA